MNENLAYLLANSSSFYGLLPSMIALLVIKRGDKTIHLLALLVWGGTAISLLAYILGNYYGLSNLYLLHIYTVFEFIILALIFQAVLPPSLFRLVIIAFPFFATVNSIFIDKLATMNVLNRSISAFMLMFFALSFFRVNLREMKIERLELEPLFWISTGILFYNAASFFIFIFSKDLEPFDELWYSYFGIHSIFTILLYTFYAIALWTKLKVPQTYHSN